MRIPLLAALVGATAASSWLTQEDVNDLVDGAHAPSSPSPETSSTTAKEVEDENAWEGAAEVLIDIMEAGDDSQGPLPLSRKRRRRQGELRIIPKVTPKTIMIQAILRFGVLVPLEIIQAAILEAFPEQPLISLSELHALRLSILGFVSRPFPFHTAVLSAPAEASDREVFEFIKSRLPPFHSTLEPVLRRAIQVWRDFCIKPLREWSMESGAPPPCVRHAAFVRGRHVDRVALSKEMIIQYLQQALLRAQDGLEAI